jgi:hypothetical protein
MGNHAFIAYSIQQTDAHMVYELGELLEKQGMTAVYNYDHPEHPRGQHSYDEVAQSTLFVGLITAGSKAAQVIQLWQYARSQGIPAIVLLLEGVSVHSSVSRHPDVVKFKRFMAENPIRFVEIWMSHH